MAKPFMVNVLDHHKVSPPENSASPSSLPLTFFDIPWLFFSPSQTLFFFEYSHSTSHFLSTTLPALVYSLSLTLQHYFPFAGNLVLQPENAFKPLIVYNEDDFVSLSVAESSSGHDLFHFSGNHQRCCSEFYALLPELPNRASEDKQGIPLLAAKVTIFSSSGICIGLTYHHVAADGRTFNNFMKTWAAFFRQDSSDFFIKFPPFLDRTVIKNAHGLESIFFNDWRKKKLSCEGMVVLGDETKVDSSDMVRATFVMSPADMDKVKQSIVARCKKKNESHPPLMSPSNLTCAFVWVCLTKAQETVHDNYSPEDPSYFGFNAGCITRLDYPVPTSYFGNYIGFARCMATTGELSGEDGIIVAANEIGNKVKALDRAVLDGAEKWISDWEVFSGSGPNIMVVGSPKLDFYGIDFGWGRPKKIEEISIDSVSGNIAVSFTESKDMRGGIEVGVALPKPKMDAFASAFNRGLP